jgi:hypothetical protein
MTLTYLEAGGLELPVLVQHLVEVEVRVRDLLPDQPGLHPHRASTLTILSHWSTNQRTLLLAKSNRESSIGSGRPEEIPIGQASQGGKNIGQDGQRTLPIGQVVKGNSQ